MEMEDVMTVGVVGLILYLLLRAKRQARLFEPWVPVEDVTSTITFQE